MTLRHGIDWLVVLSALAQTLGSVHAADYYARTAGAGTITTNWNQNTTWTASATCNGAATAGVPGAADNAFICAGKTVNVTAAAAANSVTFVAVGAASTLTHAGANTLTVGAGGVTINGSSSANGNRLWDIAAGTGTVNGPVTLNQGSTNNRIARINLSTGTLDVNSNLTMATSNNARTVIVATGAANIFVSGNFALTNDLGTLTPGTTSTFTYDTAGAASVATGGAVTYNNLTINKAGGTATTLGAPAAPRTFTVARNLNVQAGTLDITSVNATIASTAGFSTTVGGTLQISSVTGTKTFTGPVTITGTWDNSANEDVAIGNSLTNNGTFTSGTGLHTFQTTAGASWAGTSGLTFSGNVAVNATRTNNTTTTVVGNLTGSSTLTNAANQTLNIGGNANGITGLTATAVGNIVNYNGGAPQIAENTTYHHLTISNTTGPVTLAGNTNIQGNLLNNGNFDGVNGNRTVTFNGGTTQTISGTSPTTSLYRLTLNNAAGLTLSGVHDLTVTNLLTLTAGPITTGTNVVYISNGSAIGSVGVNDFVIGNLRKNFSTGANISRVFEVGSGLTPNARYTPVNVRFGSVTATGDFTISTTGADHPNIGASPVNPLQSVNRYWTLTNDSVGFQSVNANNRVIFTYVSPADIDAGVAVPFVVGRYNTPNWTSITPTVAVPNVTLPAAVVTNATMAGSADYAIGEAAPVVPPPTDFNAFETTTGAGAITGKIFTKLVGTGFDVAVVAISGGVRYNAFSNTVAVDLVTGSTGGLNCPGTPVTIAGTSQNVALTTGRSVIHPNFNVADAYPDVRVRIRFPVGAPTVISCSIDNFAIRPTGLTITSTNASGGTAANNTDNSGTPIIKAGANFNLTATAVPGYNGTPTINNALVIGTPNAGTIGGTFSAALAGTGVATGNSFFYSEVGNFGLATNAVFDAGFAGVDSGSGDCTNDFSNTLVGGRYGCSFGSNAVAQTTGVSGFGRFIPDNFSVSYNVPALATACSGFSYVGQTFSYTMAPVLTVTARNGTGNGLTNATTTNYAGSYMKFTNTRLAQAPYATQAGRYTWFDALGVSTPALDLSGLPLTSADPAISAFANGAGTFTFAAGTGFSFMRNATTPSAPFDADIALALSVIDTDGVTFIGNPAVFGAATASNGIDFNNGKSMRYGRLRLGGASGSSLLLLRVPVEAQYWNGTSFVTNGNDDCTALTSANMGLGNSIGGIVTSVTAVTSPLQKGRGVVTLAKPTGGTSGSIDVAVNLGVPPGTGTADACPYPPAVPFTPTATAANKSYLRGLWCVPVVPPGTYTKDPSARARFGIQRGSDEAIYTRENTN